MNRTPSRDTRRRWWGRKLVLAGLATLAVGFFLGHVWPTPVSPLLTRPGVAQRTPYPEIDLVVDGTRLRLIDVGPRDGKATPLVLLEGHTSRIEEYDRLLPRLTRDRRVIVFDFPGCGYSDKPERRYTLEYFERVVIAVLDKLEVRRAHLAGGSLGGHLTLRLAAHHPDRFERLVPWSPGGAWQARPTLARAIDAVSTYGFFVPTVRVQSTYWFRADWPGREAALTEIFRYYGEVMSPGFVAMYWGMAQDQVGQSLFDVVGAVRQPTLLIAGDRDTTPGILDGVRRIQGLMPACELRVYAGVGHALAAEEPERLVEDMARFLEGS